MPVEYFKMSGVRSGILYTTNEVAVLLKVTPRLIQRLAKKGKIHKLAGAYLFTQEDIAEFNKRPKKPGRIKE